MCERIPVAVDGSDTSNRVVDRPKWLPPAPIRPSQQPTPVSLQYEAPTGSGRCRPAFTASLAIAGWF